jgi:RNA polymerase sigma-70 factor (ECF subfamily)
MLKIRVAPIPATNEISIMSGDQTSYLQGLIDRVRQGDEAARKELINHAYEKLRRLAGKMLGESFPRLKEPPALQDTTDIANEAAQRLYLALQEVPIATVRDFFRLAAWRMRMILLDLAKKTDHHIQHGLVSFPRGDVPQAGNKTSLLKDALDQSDSATTIELHHQIGQLPKEEQEVVELRFYHDLSETETAAVLGVSTRTVRRRWTSAKLKLFDALQKGKPG